MANDIANPDAGLSPAIEIAAGKLRGWSSAGVYSFKGIPLWRFSYGAQPLHAATAAPSLGRRAGRHRLRRPRVAIAKPREVPPGARNLAWAGGRYTGGGGPPDPECVDIRSRRRGQADRSWSGCTAARLVTARATGRGP